MEITRKVQGNKETALDFLQLIVAGHIDEAYAKYVDMQGKHHNVYNPSGFLALKLAMQENQDQFPYKQISIKNVLEDGDLVAVHSNIVMKTSEPGIAVVHIFRLNKGRIVEMWDVGQAIPADSPNQAGAF